MRTSLEADGELSQIKAEMRTKVMKLLEGSSKSSRSKQPKPPNEVLIINELIREYLDWMGYKYTSSVLVSGEEHYKNNLFIKNTHTHTLFIFSVISFIKYHTSLQYRM